MANRYFRNTGDMEWNLASNWSATDGGASVGAIPTAADDVFFTANSGSVYVAVTAANVKTLDCTGYTGTITIKDAGLLINGNATFNSNMRAVNESTANISIEATANLITGGMPFQRLRFRTSNGTVTLMDTLRVTGGLTINGNNTIAGDFGFIVESLNLTGGSGHTYTLKVGNTYRVQSMLNTSASKPATKYTVKSSVAGTKAILTVTGDANVGYTIFTDIDASGGRTIYDFLGTVNSCTNIEAISERVDPVNTTTSSISMT